MYTYEKATMDALDRIWNRNILENPGDDRWPRWKDAFLGRNRRGEAATFVVLEDQEPLGEVTLEYYQSGSRSVLANGRDQGYVQALRLHPSLQGMGHASRLMAALEEYAWKTGLTRLTIGVEAADTRNLQIYLHWGYDRLLLWEDEGDGLVLFYEKDLTVHREKEITP